MKLTTVLTLGATGMVATAAAVWFAVDPARPAAASAARGAPGASSLLATGQPDRPVKPPGPPPVDHSHFQAGKTLMVEGRLGHQVLPADTDSETFLFVDINADAAAQAPHPAPLDLAVVIDRSGSMKGKRLANAMAATRTAIERLRDGDVVSVVTYDTRADVVVPPTAIDATSRARVLRQLARPMAGGDTCISCGIDAAMQLLGQRPEMVSRVLLLSDGFATAGVRDLPGFRRIADDVRRLGASITTIGVDVGYDEKVMAALARDSNGDHFFVPDAATLPGIFDREMASLTRTVANHADLVVDLAPGVFVEHVYDRVSTGGSGQVIVPFGAFTAGDHKTALLRLQVPRGAAGEHAIATVRLRYDDLVTEKPGACEGNLALRTSTDAAEVTPLDGIVSARVSASETAEALENANELFRQGRTLEATQLIQQQNMHMEMEHMRARKEVEPMRMHDVDDAFLMQKAAMDKADLGFQPATAAAPAPTVGDRQAEAQARSNQAGALKLEE
ncbi:MAG TPA: VWA domain-containing protein [Kofleriaceae bacterium]|nr:VWA domain-containing protein [Kofleriaceae bacterium]